MSSNHTTVYVELGVADVAAAKAFYEAALGWVFNDYGPDYAGIRSADGESEVGGLNGNGTGGRGGTLLLLESGDVDASLAAVESAGGVVVDTLAPYPGGRRFTFTDPDGNHLGVFQPGE